MSETQLNKWLAARPADTDPAWAQWAKTELSQFWCLVSRHKLVTADELHLHYVTYQHPQSRGWVVISPGRIETYLKYQEVMLELAAQGYSVAALDHRGQGFSERISHHPQHGHVNHFGDFVRDFSDLMLALRPRIGSQPCHLLAHSMGSAIACLYMANYPNPFNSAVLSAPMMGIQTRPWPYAVAQGLIRAGHWLNRSVLGDKPRYFLGMKDYTDIRFEKNRLTHSAQRYEWFRQMYLQRPEIQLGGPTVQWLIQSLEAMAELPEASAKLSVPVLLLQAERDKVVAPQPQQRFIELAPHRQSRLELISGSYHEILMETDSIRRPALNKALAWFDTYQQAKPEEQDAIAPRRNRAGARLRSL